MSYKNNLAGLMAKMLNETSGLENEVRAGGKFKILVEGPTYWKQYHVMAEFNKQRARWEVLEVQE